MELQSASRGARRVVASLFRDDPMSSFDTVDDSTLYFVVYFNPFRILFSVMEHPLLRTRSCYHLR